jgi:prepilin-type processing-associated H-X9-DG protein
MTDPKMQDLEKQQEVELTAEQAEEAQGGSAHTGGINAALGDGSVRGRNDPNPQILIGL